MTLYQTIGVVMLSVGILVLAGAVFWVWLDPAYKRDKLRDTIRRNLERDL